VDLLTDSLILLTEAFLRLITFADLSFLMTIWWVFYQKKT